MKYKINYLDEEKEQIISIGPVGSDASVEIPSDVSKLIGSNFYKCTNLKAVIIPKNIKIIELGAFGNCFELKTVTMSYPIDICEGVFIKCLSLKHVHLPYGLKDIKKCTFAFCESLENLSIPTTVKYIGAEAFRSCVSLETIIIPDSVTKIDKAAFLNCENLKSAVIPSSVKYIDSWIFSGCDLLKDVTIKAECKLPENMLGNGDSLEIVRITQKAYDLSPEFVAAYKEKIKIIQQKSLEELLDEGKSLREVSQILKDEER